MSLFIVNDPEAKHVRIRLLIILFNYIAVYRWEVGLRFMKD